eukprot:401854-Rhodomonas_salina.1
MAPFSCVTSVGVNSADVIPSKRNSSTSQSEALTVLKSRTAVVDACAVSAEVGGGEGCSVDRGDVTGWAKVTVVVILAAVASVVTVGEDDEVVCGSLEGKKEEAEVTGAEPDGVDAVGRVVADTDVAGMELVGVSNIAVVEKKLVVGSIGLLVAGELVVRVTAEVLEGPAEVPTVDGKVVGTRGALVEELVVGSGLEVVENELVVCAAVACADDEVVGATVVEEEETMLEAAGLVEEEEGPAELPKSIL